MYRLSIWKVIFDEEVIFDEKEGTSEEVEGLPGIEEEYVEGALRFSLLNIPSNLSCLKVYILACIILSKSARSNLSIRLYLPGL